MKAGSVIFKNMLLLQQSFESEQNFYLHFDIDVGNDKHLKQIVKMCIEHSTCRGLIFYFDQDRFKFEKLFFLKDIIELLLVSCKQIDLIGIPVCVIRTLLGGYLYMRFITIK